MTIEDRITRLENENRRLARTVVALSGAGGVAAAVGFAGGAGAAATTMILGFSGALWMSVRSAMRAPDVLQARKLEVVNDMGQVLVALGETAEGEGAIATYGVAGDRLGHITRVDDDAIVLRKPTEEDAPKELGAPRSRHIENSH